MPQSLHQKYGHIVFLTKNRLPLIPPEIEGDLYAYLGGIVRNLGGSVIEVNGMPDHVHLLIRESKSIADADFMQKLKSCSSAWMKEQREPLFAWQEGYGWFSVSSKNLDAAREYVVEQKSHHAVVTFEDEYRKLLTAFGVEYDERYLWGWPRSLHHFQ